LTKLFDPNKIKKKQFPLKVGSNATKTMAYYQVTCITKPNAFSRHEHITHIGNPSAGWKITREDAIRRIDSGSDIFYVKDPQSDKIALIFVRREFGKIPFLQTYADRDWNDNLLSLNQCSI
jgi:hypothetical protein